MARRRLLYHYFYLTYGGERYSEEVTVSPFSPDGGADGFSVKSSKAWEVLSSPSWLWISPAVGEKGITQVQISAGTYAEGTVREDNITIRTVDGRYTATIHVSQMADVPYITVTGQPAGTVPFRNENTVLSVSSKGGWTAAVTGATLNPTAQTNVGSVVTETVVTYGRNTSTSDTRTVTVVFTNTQDTTKSVTVTIVQAPQSHIGLQCSHTTPVPYTGGTVVFTAETNYAGTISAPAGVSLSLTAISPGATEITATFPSLSTGQTEDVTRVITGKTNDYLAEDGISRDELTLLQERYPYIDATGTTCDSAATTGSVSYQSNYIVAAGAGTSTGLTNVVVENGQAKFDFVNPPSWDEETYNLQLVTVNTYGPDVTTSVTVTRKAKVAELTAQNATAGKDGGVIGIPFNSNDEIIVGQLPEWASLSGIDYENGVIWVNVDPWTGATSRSGDIPIQTTHDGPGGAPVSVSVTLAQTAADPTIVPVPVDYYLKQDSDGEWYIRTVAFTGVPITVSYSVWETGTSTNNGDYINTHFETEPGEDMGVPSFTATYYDEATNTEYQMTYNRKEQTPYTETETFGSLVSIDLVYDDYDFLADGYASRTGQQYEEFANPTALTVVYDVTVSNSFDTATTTETRTLEGVGYLETAHKGTWYDDRGTLNDDNTVRAGSRTNVEGEQWTIGVITGATVSISGQSHTGALVTAREFTQAKNEAYCNEGEIKKRTGSRTETKYRNSGFTTNPTGFTYPASGGSKGFAVNVTAQTQVNTATTYNVTPYTACIYDSGYDEPPTCGQTTTETDWEYGTWRPNYKEPARFWKASGDTSWFNAPSTAENSPITVTASTRGTTAGSTRPSAYLLFDSPLNIYDEVAISISQAANTRTCDGGTPSTRTSRVSKPPQQESMSISISASETGFKANGKTHNGNNYATITASETARKRTVTDVTTYTDTAYTCQWSSKEPESWTDMDNTGVTTVEYGDWQTYYPTPDISKKASTGDSLSYDSTNQRVTATNLGTVTGETNSIQIQAVSTIDASKTDTVTLNQDVNTVTGKTCDLDVSPTSIRFTDTTTSSTVSITSRTTTEYASEATETEDREPTVSISGDSQHFAQTMSFNTRTHVYRSTVTSTYPSTPGGPTSPLAYVKYSSPDCPSETESVGITYDGPAQNVYPTIVGVNASVHSQYNTLGISVNFDTSNATPNLTWEFKITGQTVPIFSDGTIILTLTGKTNSMGNGVENIKVISQDGSWYTDEFTLEMIGSNILTITTPYQQGRTFTFNATCTQQPQAF